MPDLPLPAVNSTLSMDAHAGEIWDFAPLQCNTITRSGAPSSQAYISRVARGKSASGGALWEPSPVRDAV